MKNPIIIFCLMALLISIRLGASERAPLIGITPSFADNAIKLNADYVEAVQKSGGIAIILTPTSDKNTIETYVRMLDGAVFSGGPDIPPEYYGQQPHATTGIMEKPRFDFERLFISAFLDSGKPALGICLGMQFSNVCRGGTLIQDIPELIGKKERHRDGNMYTNFHRIAIAPGSLLAEVLQTRACKVLSRHHQAIGQLGKGFKPTARSSDGVIEAIERCDGAFGLFVQWHPESMKDADPTHVKKLFDALVKAARSQKEAPTEW